MSKHTNETSLERLEQKLAKTRSWLEMEKRRNAPPHVRFYAMGVVGKTQKELRLAQQRIEKLEAEVSDGCDLIRWIAQTVHQGYHADLPGTFFQCPKSICAAARAYLATHQREEEA